MYKVVETLAHVLVGPVLERGEGDLSRPLPHVGEEDEQVADGEEGLLLERDVRGVHHHVLRHLHNTTQKCLTYWLRIRTVLHGPGSSKQNPDFIDPGPDPSAFWRLLTNVIFYYTCIRIIRQK